MEREFKRNWKCRQEERFERGSKFESSAEAVILGCLNFFVDFRLFNKKTRGMLQKEEYVAKIWCCNKVGSD